MKRIDENTYIDETLVTYAEYQLFIDEMRAQGKYYQPDHWISYQFPAGKAQEPVLGVRHSDAIAFCEWVTNREASEWKYRLPTEKEFKNFPMEAFAKRPLGSWVNERFQIAWIGSVPDDARILNIDLALAYVRDLELNLIRARDLGRAHDLTSLFDHVRDLARALDRTADHPRDRILELNRASDLTLDVGLVLSRDLRLARDQARELVTASDLAEHLYVDISSLRERIAGRSPAFEGIRLIKEQIR
jgi:hypothetical protein